MQTTLRTAVTFQGVGLHSGRKTSVVVHPAAAHHGVWLRRTDIALGNTMIPARWDAVEQTALCTRVRNDAGVSVSTIEHLMAALAGCGIRNALIEIDAEEVPILDGSAVPFVRAFLDAGIQRQDAPVYALEILETVDVRAGDAWARLSPAAGMKMTFHIAFADRAIGTQDKTLDLANGSFVRELSDSRTFCRKSDVETMQANGLALGGQPGTNAVVFDGDRVDSPGGLRHADEPVRHKMLDALGDLYLAGAPILGHYEGFKAGHSLTNALLRALFATPGAFRLVECTPSMAATLPGAGVHRGEVPKVA